MSSNKKTTRGTNATKKKRQMLVECVKKKFTSFESEAQSKLYSATSLIRSAVIRILQ
jgi:hypothetical protein